MPSIEVGPTAQPDLDVQSPTKYVHDLYSHAKVQGQGSDGSEDGVKTNGRT